MTRDDIIGMAQEANRHANNQTGDSYDAAAEREACAQAAEGFDACDPKHIAAAFRAGAKAMFDALLYRVANNWHPRAQAECNAQNEWATEWAADALDEVSPEDCAKWKSIQQSWGDGYKAGAAAEREACAKVCEQYDDDGGAGETWGPRFAEIMRARGPQ